MNEKELVKHFYEILLSTDTQLEKDTSDQQRLFYQGIAEGMVQLAKETLTSKTHYLYGGLAACSIKGLPGEWPEGNLWSSLWGDVTCLDCLQLKDLYLRTEALGRQLLSQKS